MKLPILICALLCVSWAVNAQILPISTADPPAECTADWAGAIKNADGTVSLYSQPDTRIGGAPIRVFVTADPNEPCKPLQTGVEIPKAVLSDLPSLNESLFIPSAECGTNPAFTPGCEPHMTALSFALPVPGLSIFKSVNVTYLPIGHSPVGVYSVPHFDLYYVLDEPELYDQVLEGPCYGVSVEAFEVANQPIPIKCFPRGYANGNSPIYRQGAHYNSIETPHFLSLANRYPDASLWNTSFHYGGVGGKIAFYNPMAKPVFLENVNTTESCLDVPSVPLEVADEGYYPMKWCFKDVNNTVHWYFTDFIYRPAGCKGGPLSPLSYYNVFPPSPLIPPLPEECKAPFFDGDAIAWAREQAALVLAARAPSADGSSVPAPAPASSAGRLTGLLAGVAAVAAAMLA